MKKQPMSESKDAQLHRRLFLLAAFLQLGCAAIFFGDVVQDIRELSALTWSAHTWLEVAGVFALGFGAGLSLWEYRRLLRRNTQVELALGTASGAFQQTIEYHFDQWGLSPAERDVALLSVKGATIPEIARMRSTCEGTVKAQNAAIYRKAGVSSRAELITVLIGGLIEGVDITGQKKNMSDPSDSSLTVPLNPPPP